MASTTTSSGTTPVTNTTITILTWLKYLLPVAAGIASIWLHNATTVTNIGETLGAVESGLQAATPNS